MLDVQFIRACIAAVAKRPQDLELLADRVNMHFFEADEEDGIYPRRYDITMNTWKYMCPMIKMTKYIEGIEPRLEQLSVDLTLQL